MQSGARQRSKAYRGVALEGGVACWYVARAQKARAEKQALARRVAEFQEGPMVLELWARKTAS